MKPYFFSFLAVVFCSICNCFVFAQNNLSGNIIDKTTSKVLQGVTIKLTSALDSSTLSLVTNASGIFGKTNVKAGNYTLTTNFIGYKSEGRQVHFSGKPVHIFLRLEPAEIAIEEVEIVAPPMVKMMTDTMEFDARNFSTREFAEADELVAQIPGVLIDEEGNVSAHGEQVTKIIVDGKEFFSTDPRIALKTLPAEIISKIQIIDEKSEQARFSGFDDGKRNKVINIVTKPDRRHGYFGKADGGLGAAGKFGLNANINNFNADKKIAVNLMANNINETNFAEQGRGGARRGNNNTERGLSDTYAGAINFTNTYLDKQMEVSGDYNFRSLGTVTETRSEIEYLQQRQQNQFRTQTQFGDVTTKEHKFDSRLRWNIDSIHRLDFSPKITYTHVLRDGRTDFTTLLNNDINTPINRSERANTADNANFNFSGALTYMYRFRKKGRTISASMSANKSSNEALGLNLAETDIYRNGEFVRRDPNNNQSITAGYGSGFSNRISFTENLSVLSRLQANYSIRNTANYSNRETYEFLVETGQLGEVRERLSNEFRNDFIYHRGGASYLYNKRDVFRLQLGLNYEHGTRKNDRTVPYPIYTSANFDSFQPEFTLIYNIQKERIIEVNYNAETTTPSIAQLQDFTNNQNELNITRGNPNLNQEYTHLFRAQYKDVNKTTGRSLNTNVQFDYVNNKIINAVILTEDDLLLEPDVVLRAGGRFTTYENKTGAYAVRAQNSYGLPIKKWKINLNFNTRLFYNNDYVVQNAELLNSKAYGFSQAFGINSNIKKQYVLGLNYNIRGNYYENPIAPVPIYNVYIHRLNNNVTVELLKKIVLQSNLTYFINSGLMGAAPIETTVWSASIGYKLFKKKDGLLTIKGFDLLNNAQNVNRNVDLNAVSDVTSNTLNRYFIMAFTYNLRQFGTNQGKNR